MVPGAWPTPSVADLQQSDYVVWGGGNHPVDLDYDKRTGVNDAAVVNKRILMPTCVSAFRQCVDKIVWLGTHARLNGRFDDEKQQQIYEYHKEMPVVLLKTCGISKIASVWNETDSLVRSHVNDARKMTWDGMHWGTKNP